MHGTVPCTDARIVSSTVLADSSRNCESSERVGYGYGGEIH